MSKARIRITKKDTRKLKQLIRDVPQMVDAAGRKAVTEMTNDMKQSMLESPPDTSKSYRRGGAAHHPSFPDHPPRPDTSSLFNSIRWKDAGRLKWHIEDGVLHGIYMEWGTETVQARPFAAPVFENWRNAEFLPFMVRELNFG